MTDYSKIRCQDCHHGWHWHNDKKGCNISGCKCGAGVPKGVKA
jgi:hypothetical protein